MSHCFRLMGIVNVTPDSFSDGGRFLDPAAAVEHALGLIHEGADIVDIGGESTRPGAAPVDEREELRRVIPVIEGVVGARVQAQISIDTSKAAVARAAIAAGASLVNDVTALRGDPQMAAVIAEARAECCLMHMQGEPRTMQRAPHYEDVAAEVKTFLAERVSFATERGIASERILLDPGIGFGKTAAHNLQLIDRVGELTSIGAPILIGTSRKSFIGRILAEARGESEPPAATERLPGTLATCVMALERGASVFRVHDLAPVRDALILAAATLHAYGS